MVFQSLGNHESSTGIGLSIVKRICDLYAFNINYQFSNEHTFTIDFA